MLSDEKREPETLSHLISSYLKESGLEKRVSQAEVVPNWSVLVGAELAAVTQPLFVTRDGTLFVAVKTHAWMTELQLMESELLKAINDVERRNRYSGEHLSEEARGAVIRRLRLQLLKPEDKV